MRKLLPLLAATVAALTVSAAHADIILIDNFDTPATGAQLVSDSTTGDGANSSGSFTIPSGNGQAVNRTLLAECSTYPLSDPFGQGCTYASVAQITSSPFNGALRAGSSSGNTGTASVVWSLGAFAYGNPAAYFFNVLASNPQGTSLVDFVFRNTANTSGFTLGGQSFGSGSSTVTFALLASQVAQLSQGGTLTMNVSGGAGWNATVDSFSITVPEPTSLALVGLALLGVGVISRRRKA
jgi:hypothetical protein